MVGSASESESRGGGRFSGLGKVCSIILEQHVGKALDDGGPREILKMLIGDQCCTNKVELNALVVKAAGANRGYEGVDCREVIKGLAGVCE
jgi:hypothetical protein